MCIEERVSETIKQVGWVATQQEGRFQVVVWSSQCARNRAAQCAPRDE